MVTACNNVGYFASVYVVLTVLFWGAVKKLEQPKFWLGRVPTNPATSASNGFVGVCAPRISPV